MAGACFPVTPTPPGLVGGVGRRPGRPSPVTPPRARPGDRSPPATAITAGSSAPVPSPAKTATRATAAFGDVVFNLYGSTEVSVATLATPADLRVNPSTVGKPALGCRVRLFDDQGRPTPPGEGGVDCAR